MAEIQYYGHTRNYVLKLKRGMPPCAHKRLEQALILLWLSGYAIHSIRRRWAAPPRTYARRPSSGQEWRQGRNGGLSPSISAAPGGRQAPNKRKREDLLAAARAALPIDVRAIPIAIRAMVLLILWRGTLRLRAWIGRLSPHLRQRRCRRRSVPQLQAAGGGAL